MDWLSQNWFFVLLLVAFVGLHLFGHGGHGGHGGHRRRQRSGGEDRGDVRSDPAGSRRHDHHGGD